MNSNVIYKCNLRIFIYLIFVQGETVSSIISSRHYPKQISNEENRSRTSEILIDLLRLCGVFVWDINESRFRFCASANRMDEELVDGWFRRRRKNLNIDDPYRWCCCFAIRSRSISMRRMLFFLEFERKSRTRDANEKKWLTRKTKSKVTNTNEEKCSISWQ